MRQVLIVIAALAAVAVCAPSLHMDKDVYAPDLQNIHIQGRSSDIKFNPSAFSSQRPGTPPNGHDCNRVLNYVPTHLTFITRYNHYRKYTHAYGIPIVSSAYVSDAALKRACYVVRFLLADKSSIRYYLYKHFGRIGIMGSREGTTSIPEHRHLGTWWDTRARGLGGTLAIPISTGGEENLLCWSSDRYRNEDIFLHEFSHGIQEIAITAGAIRGYNTRLRYAYSTARSRGLWARTYAMNTWKEYFAEGVQSYFNVNAYSASADGVHNHVNTRAKLRSYDYTLYKLVKEVFPCGNIIVDRCDKSGVQRTLRTDCDRKPVPTTAKPTTQTPPLVTTLDPTASTIAPPPPLPSTAKPTVCKDENVYCSDWAWKGECSRNPDYMHKSCRKSCKLCSQCVDDNTRCAEWAGKGECQKNKAYMLVSCKKSCKVC